MDCSLPGSSVHGIFQSRVLEWGAIAFSELTVKLGSKSRQISLWKRLRMEMQNTRLHVLGSGPVSGLNGEWGCDSIANISHLIWGTRVRLTFEVRCQGGSSWFLKNNLLLFVAWGHGF